MASLDLVMPKGGEAAKRVAWTGLAIVLTLPLMQVVFGTAKNAGLFGVFAGMPPSQAVVAFGIVGGASGALAQWLAGGMLGRLGRPIHILELMPAVIASIALSVAATAVFLPPSPIGMAYSRWLDTLSFVNIGGNVA